MPHFLFKEVSVTFLVSGGVGTITLYALRELGNTLVVMSQLATFADKSLAVGLPSTIPAYVSAEVTIW